MSDLKDQMGNSVSGDYFHTEKGTPMKGGKIVTGMDKLKNPAQASPVDGIFDSSPSRDINVGSTVNENGIEYKALKAGNPLK